MQVVEHKATTPEAFRGFIEGVQNLKDYLQTSDGEKLIIAERRLGESLAVDPDFQPAQYYKAIVLTHGRKSDEAITLLEHLSRANPPYKAEVLYNLAFAYARKYDYELFKRALNVLDEADELTQTKFVGLSLRTKRPDLVLLIRAMRAFVMAAFAGRTYGHKGDFETRQREYLPKCVALTESVLSDSRLASIAPETKKAIEIEAHNAAGIAYMRMGQRFTLFAARGNKANPVYWLSLLADHNRELFGKPPEYYWKLSEQHFTSALTMNPADVRVLDNLSTLKLIQSCQALLRNDEAAAQFLSKQAEEAAMTAISHNRHDRFRHYNLAKALALLDKWDAARQAIQDLRQEPGKLSDEQADKFEQDVISARDKSPIISQYYDIEEKLPSE